MHQLSTRLAQVLPKLLSVLLLVVVAFLASTKAQAQVVLRDTETEIFLHEISAPLYRVSGIQAERVQLYIEDNDSINAFATASHLIVLSAGLVETATDPSDLQGVLAHEIAHIVAGHHVAASQAQSQAERRYLLGAAAGLILAGVTQDATAAIASTSLGQEVAAKGYLAHSRGQRTGCRPGGDSFFAAGDGLPRRITAGQSTPQRTRRPSR